MLIWKSAEPTKLLTKVPLTEIEKSKNLKPRDVKAKLAREIIRIYHGEKATVKAEEEFNRVFKEKKLPTKILEISLKEKDVNILDLLTKTKLAQSKSEAKRLILQKGVKINGEIQKDWQKMVEIKKGTIIQIGKRKFLKLV